MDKPKTENLTAWVTERNLNVFQKADAVIEYNKLLEYVDKLEKAINDTHCCKSDSELLRSSCNWCNGNNQPKSDGIANITDIG